jgi:hypothetical protein
MASTVRFVGSLAIPGRRLRSLAHSDLRLAAFALQVCVNCPARKHRPAASPFRSGGGLVSPFPHARVPAGAAFRRGRAAGGKADTAVVIPGCRAQATPWEAAPLIAWPGDGTADVSAPFAACVPADPGPFVGPAAGAPAGFLHRSGGFSVGDGVARQVGPSANWGRATAGREHVKLPHRDPQALRRSLAGPVLP